MLMMYGVFFNQYTIIVNDVMCYFSPNQNII